MRAIYSLKIIGDGDYEMEKPDLGIYDDQAFPFYPKILWCESAVTGTIDGESGANYAPLMIELSELAQSCEPDSPVVNSSDITITLSNHDKVIEYMKSRGLDILGLNARLSLNTFDSSGTLTSSELELDGKIEGLTCLDTTFTIVVSANKYARNGRMLATGEQLMIGEKESGDVYLSTIRNPGFKTVFTNDGQDAFMLIGGYDTFTPAVRQRTYQVFFKTAPPGSISNLVGWWMYVESSGTNSKGEYRKITAVTAITKVQVVDDIADTAIAATYMSNYSDGYYIEVEIEGAYTEGLVVDLTTYVKFVNFDHSYTLSKNALTGTVGRLYSLVDGGVVPFGDYGYDCTLNADGTIDVSADYPIDDDTIATYTGTPVTDFELIGNDTFGAADYEVNLREWVYELGDGGSSGDPYKNMNDLYAKLSPFEAGVFSVGGGAGGTSVLFQDIEDATDRVLSGLSYAEYYKKYTYGGNFLVGVQFKLPAIADDFKFKSVHLGLAISSTCDGGITSPGIVCLTRQAYGAAVKHFNAPLDHSSGVVQICSMPNFYLSTPMSSNTFYETDWQWETPSDTPQTRFTGLEACKLQDVDTVEKYRKILNVGLFFARGPGTDIFDTIRFFELAVIFKHENSLTEVYV